MIDVGSVLRDRYQLNARVGVGGMATVYDGQDLRLQRRVAVKIPLPVYAADPSFIKRFENEAHAAAALTHPNLVGVYDVGEAEGAPFIVMEYVDGGTLKDLLLQAAPLPPVGLDPDRHPGGRRTRHGAPPRCGPPRRQAAEHLAHARTGE